MLGVEVSSVITARVLKIAAGGETAQREFELMIAEKAEAGAQLQAKLAKLGPQASPATALKTTLRHYRRKVTANRVRLSR